MKNIALKILVIYLFLFSGGMRADGDPVTGSDTAQRFQVKVTGFNRVEIRSGQGGILYRKFPQVGPERRLTAVKAGQTLTDVVPVSLSETSCTYTIKDGNGRVISTAATNVNDWPKSTIPQLILPERPDWIALYNKAWALNWKLITASKALPAQYSYKATADNNMSYVWDACFNLLFQRYAALSGADPGTTTLDNFYAIQNKDGYIVRCFNATTFTPGYQMSKDVPDVQSVNPPLFAWAEWNYYQISADKQRLRKVLPKLIKQYEFIESFLQQKPGKYIWDGNPSGWDNIKEVQGHQYWVELPAMQALSAKCIADMANELSVSAVHTRFTAEYEKKRLQMEAYWSKEKSWYCSLDAKGNFTGKTMSGMWPVLAGLVPPERLRLMVTQNLMDPRKFLTPMPLPSLAKDEQGYNPKGGYWHGSVWINMSLMAIRGLNEHGYAKEATDLAIKTLNGMADVYNNWPQKPNTLWECYAPEFRAPASHKVRPNLGDVRADFGDWTCCLINLMIEQVMGITIDATANRINWRIGLTEEHGINNLRFGKVKTSLLKKGDTVFVKANEPFTLNLIQHNNNRLIKIHQGQQQIKL